MDSFVYRWRNQQTRMWYIGYHKGTIDDGYICSSRQAKLDITANPTMWQRKILKTGTKHDMCVLERQLLTKLQAKTNPLSYNLHNGNGHATTGRKKGSIMNPKHADLHPTALIKLSEEQIIDLLLDEMDADRRFLLHKFIIQRLRF